MSYLDRIRLGNFRESDVEVFYVTHRSDFGSFVREVGDFVAHPRRDQGATFLAATSVFSQVAFFQTYQTDKNPAQLNPFGACPWWFKSYLLAKVNMAKPAVLRKMFKSSPKDIRRKVKSWFPDDEQFPIKIEALQPYDLFDLVQFFSGSLEIRAAFEAKDVRIELLRTFRTLSIPKPVLHDFLIATSIILNGKEVEIYKGVRTNLSLVVSKPRFTPIGEPNEHGARHGISHLDGPLEITMSVNGTNDGFRKLVGVGSSFLDTEIDTEPYFDRSFSAKDDYGRNWLDLKLAKQFDSAAVPKVEKA